MVTRRFIFCVLGIAAAILPVGSSRASITYTAGTSGTGLAASVLFDNSVSGSLKITLSNIGGDVLVPADVLTAVFFNLGAGPSLVQVDAVVGTASSIVFDVAGPPATYGPGTQVGGEWGYSAALSGAPLGVNAGISSSGLGGVFGAPTFPNSNGDLEGPAALDGMQYGLLSAVDDLGTGNSPVTGDNAFIKNSVIFSFSTTGIFDTSRISNVSFQYGTALDEPNIVPPPPPETQGSEAPELPSGLVWVGLAGVVGLGARWRGLFA
jgi:hypothetical protein